MMTQANDVDRRFASVARLYGEDRLDVFKKSHICIRDGLVLPPAPPVIKSEILFFTQ